MSINEALKELEKYEELNLEDLEQLRDELYNTAQLDKATEEANGTCDSLRHGADGRYVYASSRRPTSRCTEREIGYFNGIMRTNFDIPSYVNADELVDGLVDLAIKYKADTIIVSEDMYKKYLVISNYVYQELILNDHPNQTIRVGEIIVPDSSTTKFEYDLYVTLDKDMTEKHAVVFAKKDNIAKPHCVAYCNFE